MRYLLLALLLLVSGCNTVAGFGQDMQKAGNSIKRAADRAAN
jgi:predicted small secreted protein